MIKCFDHLSPISLTIASLTPHPSPQIGRHPSMSAVLSLFEIATSTRPLIYKYAFKCQGVNSFKLSISIAIRNMFT